ncbi:MAG: MarR family transcriptional regulator [Candidatus Eremiobacteraeota bacterium]|nr:MarR family transcriptional regulator [Candidatus Eremiobacteraeota bacterium]
MPQSSSARSTSSSTLAVGVERAADEGKLPLRVWLRLLSCTRAIETEIRARLRADFDTTLPRFDVLALLEQQKGGLTMGELSTRLKVTSGNVTGLIDAMELDGLVMRKQHWTDRRSTMIFTTAKGRRFFVATAPVHHEWVDDMMAGISNADLVALVGLLDKLKASTRRAVLK